MKKLLLFLALYPLVVYSQRFGGYGRRQPNTYAPIPMQVMGEGRLTGLSAGTVLTAANCSNLFSGHWCTNGTWALYNGGGATLPTVITADANLLSYGLLMPTVTQPKPTTPTTNQCLYTECNLGGDTVPQFSYVNNTSIRPSVMVAGFTLTVSNWSGDTFRGYDIFRMGQDPYVICQFNDDISQFPPNGNILLVHTPDGAGVGGAVIVLDNGEDYKVTVLRDGPQSVAKISVVQQLPNNTYKYRGESILLLTTNGGSPLVENIFFGQHDDHAPASGTPGKLRMSNFWMSTNRQDYYDRKFPTY
jgi:hypothetical protein